MIEVQNEQIIRYQDHFELEADYIQLEKEHQ